MIIFPLSYRRYVPGVVTAWLTLIPFCYILYLAQTVLNYSNVQITLWIVIGFLLALGNVKLLHNNIHLLAKMTGE
jgi:hypothetical protein